MGRFARQFEPLYRSIRSDIYAFCDALNFKPTWQQVEVLDAIQDAQNSPKNLNPKRRIGCKSGKGPGKTTVSVVGGLWRGIQDVDALVIVTAPTMRQAKDVWLVEARRRMSLAHPLLQKFINVTRSKVVIGGRPDWGVKLVTATREENAQGYHQDRLTFICEEASGVPRPIFRAIKTTLSNPDSLLLAIGNPNIRDGDFFDAFTTQLEEWTTITLNAEESPPEIVDPERNRAIEREFGRESDVYRVSVLGEFPSSDPNCVMSSDDILACTKTDLVACSQIKRRGGDKPARQFGLDFARYGSDESVVYQRAGNSVIDGRFWAKAEPSTAVDYAFRLQADSFWKDEECWFVPDATGMGQGVLHKFYGPGMHKQVIEFHNHGTPSDQKKYDNRITEAWFEFAKLVKAKECHLPKDNMLVQQLSTRQYYTNKKGKLVLESKDDYMHRGFNSPDRADALVMTFYDSVSANAQIAGRGPGTSIGFKSRSA